MKNILVPTDFSACAGFAFDVGIKLAKKLGAHLHLFTSIPIAKDWEHFSEEKRKLYPESLQTIENTQVLLNDWKDKAKAAGLSDVNIIYTGEDLLRGLTKYVNKLKVDLVIMGSHGLGGPYELTVGSNTQRVVRRLHVPILTIKEPIDNVDFKTVAYASNFNAKEKKTFQRFLKFIQPFDPEIHLVAINTSGFFTQPYMITKEAMDDFKDMCAPMKCQIHFFKDFTIDMGIQHLAEEIKADLIVISNRERHPLRRIFAGSNVEALVNYAEHPVLSIDYKETED